MVGVNYVRDFRCPHIPDSDYNYVREGDICVPVGREPIPAGVCASDKPNETYRGSSGYRLIPGNTCVKEGGVRKDDPVTKSCDEAEPEEGEVVHQMFSFPSLIGPHAYFRKSKTLLIQLWDGTVWQSSNEGYTWKQLFPEENILAFYMHTYADDRAYLFTGTNKFFYTTDGGRQWLPQEGPLPPNRQGVPLLAFHPTFSDHLIWSGDADCGANGNQATCRVESWYSLDHGRKWTFVEKYVKQCTFARDSSFRIDETAILCESYRDKQGNQLGFGSANPLELVIGNKYYTQKHKLFNQIVGYTTFSEYLLVAELVPGTGSLDLQVSLNGNEFAKGLFPPDMRLDNRVSHCHHPSSMRFNSWSRRILFWNQLPMLSSCMSRCLRSRMLNGEIYSSPTLMVPIMV